MSEQAEFQRAKFVPQTDGAEEVEVHFNPASLQFAVSNTLKDQGDGNSSKQYVSSSTAKLSMELLFDTTDSGEDVRSYTEKMARFMEPGESKVPPIIKFEWGAYSFQGMVESFSETIDFFAPSGVPLRSSVSLSMSSQDKVFESGGTGAPVDTAGSLTDAVELPAAGGSLGIGLSAGIDLSASIGGAASIAAGIGSPDAAKAIAALNGEESLRFSSGGLTISGSVELGAPAAFSSGGGIGLGIDADLGIGVDVGASASIGASASAGLSASEGAFSGLSSSSGVSTSASLNVNKLLPDASAASAGIDVGVGISLGGAATAGAGGLTADVGVDVRLGDRIQFD